MPHESRASGNSIASGPFEDACNGVACAAGQAQTFVYSFKIDRPGRFIAFRGDTQIGAIEFLQGGWIAYELQQGRRRTSPNGRLKAYAAAHDLWGEFAGEQMRFLPENRPPEPRRNEVAIIPENRSHA